MKQQIQDLVDGLRNEGYGDDLIARHLIEQLETLLENAPAEAQASLFDALSQLEEAAQRIQDKRGS